MNINKGAKWHWKHDPKTKLIYLGLNHSGKGRWHQFAKVEFPEIVWCEVLTEDLRLMEETK